MFRQTGLALAGAAAGGPSKRPLYHRMAMPIRHGTRWNGHYGAVGRFLATTVVQEEVTDKKNVVAVDREIMNYLHSTKVRQFQLNVSYQKSPPSFRRAKTEGEYWRRQWYRKLCKSFTAFMHYKIKKTLQEQSTLVTKYGQASVNAALGEIAEDTPRKEREARFTGIHRRVQSLPMVQAAPRHVVTPRQRYNDRFDRRPRMH